MQISIPKPRIRAILFVTVLTTIFTMLGTEILFANEVTLIKTKVEPGKTKAPCPVTLSFSSYILADDFGEIKYRWVRSDEEQMPTETLSLPSNKRKRGGNVTMSWDVSPINSPAGKEYWADVEIVSPDSLGSSGRARAFVLCDGLSPSAQTADTNNQSENSTENENQADNSGSNTHQAGDDLFVLGGEDEEEEIVIDDGGGEGVPVPQLEPEQQRPALRPIEFACPVSTIGIQVASSLPAGWQKDTNHHTATADLKAHQVSNTTQGTRLECLYQKGRWLLPLTRPMPDGYKECKRIANFYFRCTG